MLHERPMSYLYEVGIQGGIRRAADILGINPSVISRQIAQLERTLELPLLERQGAMWRLLKPDVCWPRITTKAASGGKSWRVI